MVNRIWGCLDVEKVRLRKLFALERAICLCLVVICEEKLTNMEDKEEIIKHIVDQFEALYKREDRDRPFLDKLEFANIGEEKPNW